MDELPDSSADSEAGSGSVVASPDVDDADRRARHSLVAALVLALVLALAWFTSANGVKDASSPDTDDESPEGESVLPEACRFSEEVEAALAAAETPWDYMLVLGYPADVINDLLNAQAELVMEEHANGQVRWDPEANDGIYAEEAQLVLIMGADDEIEEVTATQEVMELLRICTSGTGNEALPAVS